MTITRYQSGPRMSQAVRHGNTVYLAGQVAKDYDASIEVQTQQVLDAIDALLTEVGTTKSHILQTTVILNNIADFAAMNSVYDKWIDKANPSTRACIEARLAHPSLRVEIIVIAAMPE
jgi:enamine deaminase RidA (YjgF/YER057c/UK114 family)